jgi:hypothetical protein
MDNVARRDMFALAATKEDIARHSEWTISPDPKEAKIGFGDYKYTIEEARYRYADAMIAASLKDFRPFVEETRTLDMGD